MERIFSEYSSSISLIVHAAAQPSHDWAARDPHTDFTVNANGTLTLLELARIYARQVVFIFTSTNKVYGDLPNHLPLLEQQTRWEIEPGHRFRNGINESMPIDQTTHSLFGVSKVSADLLVQEYGRYFQMATACFRGGCLTGPAHSGAELHGFLAYLMKCVVSGHRYTVYGYKGKQVRDNIHSSDLVTAFDCFYRAPQSAAVYNIGGGRFSHCSVLEAIQLCEKIAGRKLETEYCDKNRQGDHLWWVSDTSKFEADYPQWRRRFGLEEILTQIYEAAVLQPTVKGAQAR
jgi:CDP-paratose 2-epimerase